MKAILKMEDGVFRLMVYNEATAMLCLEFNDWLVARVTLDNFQDSMTIESIEDHTMYNEVYGYSPVKGIDL